MPAADRAARQHHLHQERRYPRHPQHRHNPAQIRRVPVASIGGLAQVFEGRQATLTADLQLSDLNTELKNVLGLPLDTQLELDAAVPTSFETSTKAEYLNIAWSQSPQILEAEAKVIQARAAVKAAETAYIPDVTAYARDSYQNGLPFLVHNFGEYQCRRWRHMLDE